MNEKTNIEQGTADGFLSIYNPHHGTDYEIIEVSDAPDIRCRDSEGSELNLEITTTEDNDRDIQALLGRSNHLSIEALEKHNERVAAGLEKPKINSLSGNVSDNLIARIQSKLNKDYGNNVALVVRDTSGCDWELDEVENEIRSRLDLSRNPFEKGIWVLSRVKNKLFRIV
jgi:hypothetical protein